MTEWLLVGVFLTPYNNHEVIERFATKKECEEVIKTIGYFETFSDGLEKEKTKCIEVKVRGKV
jgi:hypothetical protein